MSPEVMALATGPAVVPYAKGFYGVDYRTVLSLHRNVGSTASALQPGDPAWDVWVDTLPFLIASAESRTYVRESTQQRRERFDSARDPGENSLDSMLWLRSWTSWHMGGGQPQAEPLELDPEVARFRFSRSAGIDVWTPGQASLLRRMEVHVQSGVNHVLGVPGRGLLEARETGVWLNGTQIYSTGAIKKIAVGGTYWAGITAAGTVAYGKYDGSGTGTVAGLSTVTTITYQKNRFWAVTGPNTLQEIPNVTGTLPEALTFLDARQIIDVDSGVAGVYVMTDEGLTNIYVIGPSIDESGTLPPAINVATLPRGETGSFLYGYLGRYLAIGSTRGIRIADSGSGQSLPIGPLTIEMVGSPVDVTADGNFLWVTTAPGQGVDTLADGKAMRPGTYRIDLSRMVETNQAYGDTAAARFPYATDQYAGVAGAPLSLTVSDGRLYLVLATGQMWRTNLSAYVESGWMETGEITFATGESKTWQSLHADVGGTGWFYAEANSGGAWGPVTQNLLPVPLNADSALDNYFNPPSDSLNLRLTLRSDPVGSVSPVLRAISLRALPAAKRTRFIRLPLLAFDHEVDRQNSPIGYDGFAFDRIRDLEELEETGKIIRVLDNRTGETISCQIERISFESQTPPDRALSNWGGILALTLLVV